MAQIELRVKNKVSIGELKSGTKKIAPPLEDLEITPNANEQNFKSENYYGYDNVKVNAINLQDKTVTSSREEQLIKADDGFSGLNEVTITKPILQNKIVNPTKEEQTIKADNEFIGLDEVTINAPSLQSKIVTPTKDNQTINADNGFVGLEQVNIEPIPNNYIEPTGTLEITENGEYDVTNYASANVSIETSGGGGDSEWEAIFLSSINSSWGKNVTKLPSGLTYIRDHSFNGCLLMALTSLPSGVTNIGNNAFYGCEKLALTNLPSGVTNIGNNAFYGCEKLALTNLPSGVTTIGSSAFRNCSKLSLTNLPSGITKIENYTFYGCYAITEMTIEGNVTSVGSYAFNSCLNLTKIVFPNVTSVPTLSNKNTFASTPIASGTGYIYVPDALVDSFKSATNWSTYANQIKGVSEL